jgi:hypothetical protein
VSVVLTCVVLTGRYEMLEKYFCLLVMSLAAGVEGLARL